MLLAFDVGNTNIVVGLFKGDKLLHEFRLKTEAGRTIDEYDAILSSLFSRALATKIATQAFKFERAIISSVVPQLTSEISELIAERFNLTPLIVGPGTKTGVPIKIDDPRTLGSDRIVNAVAAKHFFGTPALVVDFGTATTFDYLSAEGAYEGGAIAPGINLSLEALVQHTAKLPQIELTWPKNAIGRTTVSAMQSGSILGYLCLVDGLITRIEAEKGPIAHIISTGGLGALITEHSTKIQRHDPDLTLKGLRIIAELNG